MIYIILAVILYTLVTLFGTAASRHADSRLVAAIQVGFSTIIPVTLLLLGGNKNSMARNRFGITMAVISGLGIGLFTWALIKSYSENKVGIVAPAVFGGVILFSTVISYFIFKEKISQLQLIGLLFLAIGFSIIIYARTTAR